MHTLDHVALWHYWPVISLEADPHRMLFIHHTSGLYQQPNLASYTGFEPLHKLTRSAMGRQRARFSSVPQPQRKWSCRSLRSNHRALVLAIVKSELL